MRQGIKEEIREDKVMIPHIFISYDVESEEHEKKIQRFVKKLRNQGFKVFTLDDMRFGERIARFLEDIENCDFVLLICTPEYKRRTERIQSGGGVVNERHIIISSIITHGSELKIIPVLFSGDWSTSLPVWAVGKKGIDYREESEEELMYFVNSVNKYVDMREMEEICEQGLCRTFTVEQVDGTLEKYNIVSAFKLIDTGDEYIVYSDDKTDREGNVIIYVSKVIEKRDNIILTEIDDETEWKIIKNILWKLGMDDDDDIDN